MTYNVIADISAYQEGLNWQKIHTQFPIGSVLHSVDGIFAKASQGATIHDAMALSHATGATQAGLPKGYYHYVKVGNPNDEAANFVSALQNLPSPEFGVGIDLEENQPKMSPADYYQWVQTFINTLVGAGYGKITIYGAPYFLNANLPHDHELGQYPLWLADYTTEAGIVIPNGWKTWTIWQYSGSGVIPAFNGAIDLSFTPDVNALIS